MKNYNPVNERIKRAYFAYLKEAKRNGEQSVDAAAKALDRFETHTRFKDFKAFHIEQAMGFKSHLSQQLNGRTKEPLSKATMLQTLAALRAFFFWLAGQQGFKSRISYSDADYFNLSAKDTAVAKAQRDIRGPTIEQVRHVLTMMPNDTDIERRNRALFAFTILTGARDNATASFLLKHIDLKDGKIVQDARDVRTKASKTFTTYFFPVGSDIRRIVEDWVTFLQGERLRGPDDLLFPATKVAIGTKRHFEAIGLDRKGWSNATPIRAIFRDAFTAAGLPYFNPHSFRNTLARFGQTICKTPEEMKAWSQNMGHDQVLTTLLAYGQVETPRQQDIMQKLWEPKMGSTNPMEALARQVAEFMRSELGQEPSEPRF